MNNNNALIIFIKNPEKGKVKTRLAKTVGNDKALHIYQRLLRHTRDIARSIDTTRFLFYSSFIDRQDTWPDLEFNKMLQKGSTLGDRIQKAFAFVFEKHDKVLIVGSDCASLSSTIIEQAFAHLDHHDFVIGPAFDGGYYLLGMTQHTPLLFENVAWSTNEVFPSTIQKIKTLNATYALLPTLSDIDTEADWDKYGLDLETI